MAKKRTKKQGQAMAGPSEKPVPTAGTATAEPKAKSAPAVGKKRSESSRPRNQPGEPAKFTWPFSKKNLYWFLGAVATILVGYIFLGQGPYDSFASLTLGPILLVIGYVVLIPVSILVRDRRNEAN